MNIELAKDFGKSNYVFGNLEEPRKLLAKMQNYFQNLREGKRAIWVYDYEIDKAKKTLQDFVLDLVAAKSLLQEKRSKSLFKADLTNKINVINSRIDQATSIYNELINQVKKREEARARYYGVPVGTQLDGGRGGSKKRVSKKKSPKKKSPKKRSLKRL